MKAMNLYFAYGSNLDTTQMFARCPDAVLDTTATLAGHRLVFLSNGKRGVANIIKDKDSTVVGALYKVSSADLINLDVHEGHPFVYKREIIEVKTAGSRIVKAITYIMVGSRTEKVPDSDYFAKLYRGFNQWGLPKITLQRALDDALDVAGTKKPVKEKAVTTESKTLNLLKKRNAEKKHLVFVYGTLLKGKGNHRGFLSDAEYIGKGIVEGKWDMYHLGAYPAIVRGAKVNQLHGEVYKVSDDELSDIDGLEGYVQGRAANLYERAEVDVLLENNEKISAYVYFMKIKREGANWKKVVNGDWRDYMEKHVDDDWRRNFDREFM